MLPPPRRIRAVLGEGVELRNRIAHVGSVDLGRDRLEEILLAVRDVLWLLDYYQGSTWALEHIRPETRKELEAGI